jgi:hypothetical protein
MELNSKFLRLIRQSIWSYFMKIYFMKIYFMIIGWRTLLLGISWFTEFKNWLQDPILVTNNFPVNKLVITLRNGASPTLRTVSCPIINWSQCQSKMGSRIYFISPSAYLRDTIYSGRRRLHADFASSNGNLQMEHLQMET